MDCLKRKTKAFLAVRSMTYSVLDVARLATERWISRCQLPRLLSIEAPEPRRDMGMSHHQSQDAKRAADRAYYAKKKQDPLWVDKECQRKREAAKASYARLKQDPDALEAFLEKKREPRRQWSRKHYDTLKAHDPESLKILIKETNRKRRAKDPEKWRQYLRDWRTKNPEKHKEYAAQSRKSQPATWRRYRKKFYKAHGPQYWIGYKTERLAKKRNAPINDFTKGQWEEMKAAYGFRCVYCNHKMQRLTQDHLTPLSKGGSHTVSNILPACQSCNSKKNAGAVLVPVQPLLLTVAPLKHNPTNENA